MSEDNSDESGASPTGRRTPGRPARLSHEIILEAAGKIPFEELSFSTVATELGVSTQALYKYFRNLDALRAGLAAKLSGQNVYEGQWRLWRSESEDIASLLTQIALSFRSWIEQNEHSPSLFQLEYGGIRFRDGGHSPVLLGAMEDFLHSASEHGVPVEQAVALWQITGDVMTTTGSLRASNEFEQEFRSDLASQVSEAEADFPMIDSYLETEPGPKQLHHYDLTVRALVLGLATLLELDAPSEAPKG